MKILITGILGTIGQPLAKELTLRGHEVWGCDLPHRPGKRYFRADVADFRQMEKVLGFTKYDYVFHLAAEFGRLNGEEHYESVWRTNVIGTRNILELQLRYDWKLIFASSSEIYGDIAEPLLNERLPATKPIRQKNDYAISKWVNELQIMNFEERYSNRVMRLRFFNCYGPGEHYHNYRSVVCLFCYRALHGLRYEVYEGYHRVFQYIDDFIPTLANATDFFRPGAVCNIGGAEYRSVREMSDIVLRTVGRDDSIVSYLSEDKHNTVNKCPDITLATLLLGHNPTTTLEKGIPLTIDWMRKTYGVL